MAPKAIFKGETFALSGKLSQSHQDYSDLIKKYGGDVVASLTASVTCLVTNQADLRSGSAKVMAAKAKGIPMVNEGYVSACVLAKSLLDVSKFIVRTGPTKRKAAAVSSACAPAKKPKPVVFTICAGASVIAKSGLADKAYVVEQDICKGYIKAKLVWDVELALTDAATGKDRFYNLQLLTSKVGTAQYWAVQHWGSTGKEGRVKVEGPFADEADARLIFTRKYRQKTGRPFGSLGDSFVEHPGKYRHLVKSTEASSPSRPGKWQYYLHNSVDGKEIAWYYYDDSMNANMEKYWRCSQTNDGMSVRVLRSDYFTYEVDYKAMLQTNLKSGTRRVIRRLAPGEASSDDAPAVIPTKVDPAPGKVADDEGDDDKEEDIEEDEAELESGDEDEDEVLDTVPATVPAMLPASASATASCVDCADTLVMPTDEGIRKAPTKGTDEVSTDDEAPACR